MDLDYFKTQIEDEIKGCEDYRAKAEECPEFHDTFTSMAEQELGHAKNLIAMVKQYANEAETVYKNYAEKLNG